jgi:hypothetical protein
LDPKERERPGASAAVAHGVNVADSAKNHPQFITKWSLLMGMIQPNKHGPFGNDQL